MTMARIAVILSAWLVLSSMTPVVRGEEAPAAGTAVAEDRDPIPRPKGPASMSPAEIDGAIDRGRRFLVGIQNADGSFGSAEKTKDLNIMAGIGSHLGFRAATTARSATQ